MVGFAYKVSKDGQSVVLTVPAYATGEMLKLYAADLAVRAGKLMAYRAEDLEQAAEDDPDDERSAEEKENRRVALRKNAEESHQTAEAFADASQKVRHKAEWLELDVLKAQRKWKKPKAKV